MVKFLELCAPDQKISLQNMDFLTRCIYFLFTFAALLMVAIAQLVRASDCGSEGRRFEPG